MSVLGFGVYELVEVVTPGIVKKYEPFAYPVKLTYCVEELTTVLGADSVICHAVPFGSPLSLKLTL